MGYHEMVTEKGGNLSRKDPFPPKPSSHHGSCHDDTELRHTYDTTILCFWQAESSEVFRQAVVPLGIGKDDDAMGAAMPCMWYKGLYGYVGSL